MSKLLSELHSIDQTGESRHDNERTKTRPYSYSAHTDAGKCNPGSHCDRRKAYFLIVA